MGEHHSPHLVDASLTGIAAGYAHLHRIDRAGALAEIADVLTRCRLTGDQAVEVLSDAAALYVDQTSAWPWAPDAIALLVEAGADPGRARELAQPRLKRPRR